MPPFLEEIFIFVIFSLIISHVVHLTLVYQSVCLATLELACYQQSVDFRVIIRDFNIVAYAIFFKPCRKTLEFNMVVYDVTTRLLLFAGFLFQNFLFFAHLVAES